MSNWASVFAFLNAVSRCFVSRFETAARTAAKFRCPDEYDLHDWIGVRVPPLFSWPADLG